MTLFAKNIPHKHKSIRGAFDKLSIYTKKIPQSKCELIKSYANKIHASEKPKNNFILQH